MLLALIHAELGGMHNVSGGIARFPHYAFGAVVRERMQSGADEHEDRAGDQHQAAAPI
jgi:hypothetical protein